MGRARRSTPDIAKASTSARATHATAGPSTCAGTTPTATAIAGTSHRYGNRGQSQAGVQGRVRSWLQRWLLAQHALGPYRFRVTAATAIPAPAAIPTTAGIRTGIPRTRHPRRLRLLLAGVRQGLLGRLRQGPRRWRRRPAIRRGAAQVVPAGRPRLRGRVPGRAIATIESRDAFRQGYERGYSDARGGYRDSGRWWPF